MATSIFGLFDDRNEAQRCIDRLVATDYDKGDISVLANKDVADFKDADTRTVDDSQGSNAAKGAATGAVTGGVLGGAGGLLLGLGALAIPGIGPIVAAGPIAAGLTGAGIGAGTGAAAGGIIGALHKAGVPEEEAHLYAEGIRRGGFLVSVTTDDMEDVPEIQQIMMDCGAVDIHRRGEFWKQQGFKKYDQSAQPYSGQQVQQERQQIQQASSDMMKFPIVQEDVQVEGLNTSDYSSLEPTFRRDYETNYANQGLSYEQVSPAYQYGYELGQNPQYQGSNWDQFESEAGQRWSQKYPNYEWPKYRNAVRSGYEASLARRNRAELI